MNEKRTLTFHQELTIAINRACAESESNTPDFILAEYLASCLAAWNKGVKRREDWYGRGPVVVEPPVSTPPAKEGE